MPLRRFACLAVALPLVLAACGGDGGAGTPVNQAVRDRLDERAPANLAHRGSGPTRPLSPLPENSLPAFRDGMAKGADGIELDVELTGDGHLLVMHDDTLDRTTTCAGCVSGYTLREAQQCALTDGRGNPTDERPPTLAQAYAAVPDDALVNVELKVFGAACTTADTGAAALARAAAAEVRRLRAGRRTLFSSFDPAAVAEIKRVDATLYAALLIGSIDADGIAAAAASGLDAIHPIWSGISAPLVAEAQRHGLQVNLWTVNGRTFLTQSLAKGPNAIITDEPALLAELLAEE
jgi:glycerophosphoryl diester phosphodiesterase